MAALALVAAAVGSAAAQQPGDLDPAPPGPPPDAGAGAPDAGPPVVDGPSLVDVARPQASAYATPSQLQLGETLTLIVEVVFDDRVTVNIPSTLDLAPAFDELRRASHDERRRDGTTKRVYELELRAWELGDINLPPIQVGYAAGGQRSWVVTNPVPLRILGLLGDVDDKTALAPDTPPVSLRRRDWRWLLAAGVALAALAIALVAWRLRKRRPPVVEGAPAPVVARPARLRLTGAAERALAALAALERDGALVREPRAGYERLVAILRTFWHDQFRVGIRDRTSGELVRALGKTPMPEAARAASGRWLERCDLVKFARAEPAAEDSAADLAAARELVHLAVGAPPAVAGERSAR
jgi:hypothetical protein